MTSPFPGMDPYLEHPEIFPDLHEDLIGQLKEALQLRLPEPYFASSKPRVWIDVSQRYIEADVKVLRPTAAPPEHQPNGAAVATLPTRGRAVLVRVPHDER